MEITKSREHEAEIVPTADGNAARKEERMRTHGWLSIKIKRKGQHALRQI